MEVIELRSRRTTHRGTLCLNAGFDEYKGAPELCYSLQIMMRLALGLLLFQGLTFGQSSSARFEDSSTYAMLMRRGSLPLLDSDPGLAWFYAFYDNTPAPSTPGAPSGTAERSCAPLEWSFRIIRRDDSRERYETFCRIGNDLLPITIEREGGKVLVEGGPERGAEGAQIFNVLGTMWPSRLPAWVPMLEGIPSDVIATYGTVTTAKVAMQIWFRSDVKPEEIIQKLREATVGEERQSGEEGRGHYQKVSPHPKPLRAFQLWWNAETAGTGAFYYLMIEGRRP